jgi:dihydrofolate reductase
VLFEAMLPRADRLRMTFVDLAPEGDAFFPAIDPALWRETERRIPDRDDRDEASCVFVDYVRV